MKKSLLFASCIFLFLNSNEQVTQINANKSLNGVVALSNTAAIFVSSIDSSIWVSDGTMAGTVQISDTIQYAGYGQLLNGKLVFKGFSPKAGKEIFITDGTLGGTKLIKDINPGSAGSQPNATTMALLNNNVYFAAVTPGEGCELWKTDGSAANTMLVKDITPGTSSGIDSGHFSISTSGSLILFDGRTTASGNELWSSAGTAATTTLLKDINTGAGSSYPRAFYPFNNTLLFTVTSADSSTTQIWKTNGTAAGTILLKTRIVPSFGLANIMFTFFHVFKNRVYFLINDGVHAGDALWSTDGTDSTTAHTSFIKDLGAQTSQSSFLLADAINLANKFIFPFSDGISIFSLWQSDGTAAGTTSFKNFPANSKGNIPFIYPATAFDSSTSTITNPLLNGKFFFSASDANGNELWTSDGTTTQLLKDIYVGPNDGITFNRSWLFTTSGLFFAADDGTHGDELWKTDGTTTTLVQDIFTGVHNADPNLVFVNNSKVFFTATDGNPADTLIRDLFVINGTFTALPVKLLDFTVEPLGRNALLQWSTAQELNSKAFIIQSSTDAQHWKILGTVPAMGSSSQVHQYSFTDKGILDSGNDLVYYRLVATDLDGNSTNSNIISLKIKSLQWNVQLFTNPVNDHVKIILSGIKGPADLSIHDFTGKEIYKRDIHDQNGLISIPVNLQSGVYILRVECNNEIQSIKLVKN